MRAFSGKGFPIGTCYRIGGDEFAVTCRNIDETTVKKSISKIKRRLAAESPDDAYCVSLAVGYAFGGGEITATDRLFRAADAAMYLDKSNASGQPENR